MAKKKRLGHKVRVLIDGAVVGFLKSVTPPELSRSETDVTDISSLITEYVDADPPEIGVVKLTIAWDPADTGDDAIDTVFWSTDPDDREVPVVIEYTSALKKDTFNGRILKITPAQIQQKEMMARDLEIRPTSKPTRSAISA
jgi:hypothetical protein